jgi:hypothetical protein
MHYGHTPCQPQVVKGTLSADKTLTGTSYYDDGSWQTFGFEWEVDKARFFHNGTQYGNTIDSSNGMFDEKMFLMLNAAAGGGLGGSVTTSQFDAGKSIYVDWIRVGEYSLTSTPTARTLSGSPPTVRLQAETYDEMLGVQFETCSDTGGGQDAGWTDPSSTQNDFIGWYVDVPATANYKVRSRSAVNKPGGASRYAIHVRKESQSYQKVLDMPVGDTGGWQNWQDFDTVPFALEQGKYWIRIEFTGASQNLNWLELIQASAGATCTDGIKNGSETGTDCGGGTCANCPTCSDGVTNQGETAMDCGGPCAACGSSGNGTGTTAGSKLEAEQYAQQSGTVLENGNTTLGYFGQNDWIRFQNVDLTNVSGLKMRVASGGGGTVSIISGCDTSGAGGTVRATHTQTSTGGWATWAEQTQGFTSFATGVTSLCLKVTSAGDAWNLDWVQLITTDNSNGSGGNQAGGNLFANPGFESGAGGWQAYFLNGGSLTTEGIYASGALGGKATIDGGGASWHAQVFQVFTTQGSSYTVSAKARNANVGNKTFEVFCEENGNSYTAYGTTSCTANDSTWTTCSVTCASMPVGLGAKFGVKAGGDASDIRLDDLSLTKN